MNESETLLIYIVSAPQDEGLRRALEKHLILLAKQQSARLWHAGIIPPGTDMQGMRENYLAKAALIVVLLSYEARPINTPQTSLRHFYFSIRSQRCRGLQSY